MYNNFYEFFTIMSLIRWKPGVPDLYSKQIGGQNQSVKTEEVNNSQLFR